MTGARTVGRSMLEEWTAQEEADLLDRSWPAPSLARGCTPALMGVSEALWLPGGTPCTEVIS